MPTTPAQGEDGTDTGILAEKGFYEATARAMYQRITPELVRIELIYHAAGPVSGGKLLAYRSDGTRTSFKDADDVVDQVEKLRVAMYREGTGTWFSTHLVVTAEGAVDASYNYDEEPEEWAFTVSPLAYVADLEDFPRDPEHIPEWLQQKVATAS